MIEIVHNMLTDKTIERVVSILREKYEAKGADLIFKTKRITVPNMGSQVVGQVLAEAVKRGYPIDYYKKPKGSLTIWKTTFDRK